MSKIDPKGSQPEALARFAESARNESKKDEGQKKNRPGLQADKQTKPIPTDPALKQDAATKVLREGVFHEDEGSREAINQLPDRTNNK